MHDNIFFTLFIIFLLKVAKIVTKLSKICFIMVSLFV